MQILGGSRDLWISAPLTLQAAAVDPDNSSDANGDPTVFLFTWAIHRTDGASIPKSVTSNLFGSAAQRDGMLTIPAGLLDPGTYGVDVQARRVEPASLADISIY